MCVRVALATPGVCVSASLSNIAAGMQHSVVEVRSLVECECDGHCVSVARVLPLSTSIMALVSSNSIRSMAGEVVDLNANMIAQGDDAQLALEISYARMVGVEIRDRWLCLLAQNKDKDEQPPPSEGCVFVIRRLALRLAHGAGHLQSASRAGSQCLDELLVLCETEVEAAGVMCRCIAEDALDPLFVIPDGHHFRPVQRDFDPQVAEHDASYSHVLERENANRKKLGDVEYCEQKILCGQMDRRRACTFVVVKCDGTELHVRLFGGVPVVYLMFELSKSYGIDPQTITLFSQQQHRKLAMREELSSDCGVLLLVVSDSGWWPVLTHPVSSTHNTGAIIHRGGGSCVALGCKVGGTVCCDGDLFATVQFRSVKGCLPQRPYVGVDGLDMPRVGEHATSTAAMIHTNNCVYVGMGKPSAVESVLLATDPTGRAVGDTVFQTWRGVSIMLQNHVLDEELMFVDVSHPHGSVAHAHDGHIACCQQGPGYGERVYDPADIPVANRFGSRQALQWGRPVSCADMQDVCLCNFDEGFLSVSLTGREFEVTTRFRNVAISLCGEHAWPDGEPVSVFIIMKNGLSFTSVPCSLASSSRVS